MNKHIPTAFSALIVCLCVPPFSAQGGGSSSQEYNVRITVDATPEVAEAVEGAKGVLQITDSKTRSPVYRQSLVINKEQEFVLPKGTYDIHAITWMPRHEGKTRVRVAESGQVSLELKKPDRHHIDIQVVDKDGIPVEGCPVRLSGNFSKSWRFYKTRKAPSQKTVTTDQNGIARFSLEGVLPDTIYVNVRDDRLIRRSKPTLGPEDWRQDAPEKVRVSRKIYNGKIHVFLQSKDEVIPVAQGIHKEMGEVHLAVLRLMAEYDGASSHNSFRLQESEVELYGLQDAVHVVRHLDVITEDRDEIRLTPATEGDRAITVKDGKILNNDRELVFMQPDAKITYTVQTTGNDEPVDHAHVQVLTRNGETVASGVTDDNGTYSTMLSPQEYDIRVRHQDYESVFRRITPDVDNKTVQISLQRLPIVSGVVRYRGQPVADVSVVVSYGPEMKRAVQTDDDGTYRHSLLRDGDCYLGVNYDGFAEFVKIRRDDNSVENVEIDLSPRYPVYIEVDGAGEQLMDRRAGLYFVPIDMPEFVANMELDARTDYSTKMNVISGEFDVYLVVLAKERVEPDSSYETYEMGRVNFTEEDQRVVLTLHADMETMDIEDLADRMRGRH